MLLFRNSNLKIYVHAELWMVHWESLYHILIGLYYDSICLDGKEDHEERLSGYVLSRQKIGREFNRRWKGEKRLEHGDV